MPSEPILDAENEPGNTQSHSFGCAFASRGGVCDCDLADEGDEHVAAENVTQWYPHRAIPRGRGWPANG